MSSNNQPPLVVMCITDKWEKGKPENQMPKFGYCYEVDETTMSMHNGKPYYYHHFKNLGLNGSFQRRSTSKAIS